MTAIAAQDETALIEGCGQQLVSGITYCRMMEGDSANSELAFVGPPTVNCKNQQTCIYFKVYFPNGEPSYGDFIPKGLSRKVVPWKALLNKSQFDLGDRGFWTFNYELHWIDNAGNEQVSVSQGEIILRVYKKDYVPLTEISSDSNFAWNWLEGSIPVKVTTGMRTYVGKRP
jgi:hypothetical protein